ncbi:MAG: M3 family oligoendopeptidase [Clostridia bacterium]|nr:M3 family oligoendopeptidase [Clostridia bacterium]
MKFSEMPYARPDVTGFLSELNALAETIRTAADAAAQVEAYRRFGAISDEFYTMASLVSVRHTIDTRDPFYDKEQEFFDEISPSVEEGVQAITRALLESPYRAELEAALGSLLFTNLEISARSFVPEMMELMQEENKLCTAYEKLRGAAMVPWEGESIPLPMLGPYKNSPDRAVRRLAFETEAAFYDEHRAELDEIFDKLVKCRNKQARMLGYENFIPLAYDRLGRNCYGPKEVDAFRQQIRTDIVPVVNQLRAEQAKRIGVDSIKIYDNDLLFPDGNATPKGSAEDILAAGKEMYHALAPETAEFIDFMYDNELLDVLSKEGKAAGGYCTEFPLYRAPFIFSNFNGTAGDVDVLTHEAGHAFAAYRAFANNVPSYYRNPTMEACEVHSMTMEFLTEAYHDKFFGDATGKYKLGHCANALTFIPYGCMVDDFQHRVYADENLTPDQRHQVWQELESIYRPYLELEDLPFFSRGATWQRQLHIYTYPFYYIDYCMAQAMAFQFWCLAMEDPAEAWRRYLAFVDLAGTRTFEELVQSAGMSLPYAPSSMHAIATRIRTWLDENQ